MYPWASRISLTAVFLAILAPTVWAAPAKPSSAVTVERIVAKVDQEIVTLSELQAFVKDEVEKLARVYKGDEFDRRKRELELRGLDVLVENKLILRRAKALGLTVGEAELEQAISAVTGRSNISNEKLREILAARGMTIEAYREHVRERLLLRKTEGLEVNLRLSVSDEEIAAYYKANQDLFREGEERHVRQIFFPIKEGASDGDVNAQRVKAGAAHKAVSAGADFAETAKKLSEGPAASRGGDLGFIKKGEVFAEFEQVIFSRHKGETSKVVKTRAGFHIVRVVDIRGGKVIPLEKVSSKIRDQLFGEKRAKRRREWISELKRASFLEIHLDPQVTPASGTGIAAVFRDVREQITFKLVGVKLEKSGELVGKDRLFWAYGSNQKDPRWKSEKIKVNDDYALGPDEIGGLENSQRQFVNPDPSASLFLFEYNYIFPNSYLGKMSFADLIKEASLKPSAKKLSIQTDSKRVRLDFEIKIEKTRSIVADPKDVGQ